MKYRMCVCSEEKGKYVIQKWRCLLQKSIMINIFHKLFPKDVNIFVNNGFDHESFDKMSLNVTPDYNFTSRSLSAVNVK